MPNPHKGEGEVKLADGRTLKLAFNANAWIEAEDALGGKPMPDIVAELQSGRASMKTQRALMWAGLRKHHPEISLEDAGELLIEAAEEMSKALAGGSPQAQEGGQADGEAGPRKRGAGTGSATRG
jgi:hypothetical protein